MAPWHPKNGGKHPKNGGNLLKTRSPGVIWPPGTPKSGVSTPKSVPGGYMVPWHPKIGDNHPKNGGSHPKISSWVGLNGSLAPQKWGNHPKNGGITPKSAPGGVKWPPGTPKMEESPQK